MSNEALRALAERLKVAKSRPGLNGYLPHTKQELFHKSTSKGTMFLGGNRSGKTVGGAVEMIYRAKGEHPYKYVPPAPTRLRSVSVDLQQGVQGIVIPELAKWMPPSLLKNGSWDDSYNKQMRRLSLLNGSFIEFLSYDQDTDKHAGTSRHGIWFDEEPPKDIFTENMARLVDTGGQWWLTMTPVEGLTWTYEDLYLNKSEDIKVIEVDMDENPHLNPVEIEAFLGALSKEERQARKTGRYISKTGMVYANHLKEIHTVPPVSGKKLQEAGELIFCSMDHGFTNPTAFLWYSVNKDGRIIVFDEYYQTQRTVEQNAKAILQKNSELGVFPQYYVGDPSIRNVDPITATSVLIEYTKNGIPIILGNNDQKAGINLVIQRLKGPEGTEPYTHPTLYITENCVSLLWEMQKLRWGAWYSKKMQQDRNAKEEQHKKDDHACDALRYGVASRPLVDDGTGVPEPRLPVEMASNAINPEQPRLASLGTKSSGPGDFHLGDEY